MAQQDGAVAGRPIQDEDDVITGATVRSPRTGGKTVRTSRSGGARVTKNKSRNKGQSSQRTAPADVQTSSQDKQRSQISPALRQELITRIRQMPSEMLAQFIKPYLELMIDKFKINTREKVANFFGQIAAESSRGNAEYVYYTSEKSFRKAFGNRVQRNHPNELMYRNPSSSRPYGFAPGKTPWELGGWPNLYYGYKNGNTLSKISIAKNNAQYVNPTSPIPTHRLNPHFYKGSPEGYAYRGHGVIQITGKVQYERMNYYYGKNGIYEKNNIDFLENPEIVSYNWKDPSNPNKFAFLSALMWWGNKDSVQINRVSLSTTQVITKRVKGSSNGYQERHRNVERYFSFLLNGVKPASSPIAGTSSPQISATFTKIIKPSELKFFSIQPSVTDETFKKLYGFKNFANLSFFEGDGTPTPPYKDKKIDMLEFLPNKDYPVLGIDKNNGVRIYNRSELFLVWNSLVYACAGFPHLIKNGKSAYNVRTKGGGGFFRSAGRTAIGIKPNGDLVVYVSKNKYIQDVTNDLLSMGCVEAINFDGGGSSFVYENGSPLMTSSRRFPTIMTWT